MDEIDEATAVAILAAQLQDLDDLQGRHQDQGLFPNEQLALRLYREELGHFATRLRDHRIGTLFGASPHTQDHLPEVPLYADPRLREQTSPPHVPKGSPRGTNNDPALQTVNDSDAQSTAQDLAAPIDDGLGERNIAVGTDETNTSNSNDDGLLTSPTCVLFGQSKS
ncbi:MAG: hypothetical protein Q9169_003499 [Polycauliona sp. 2 TL-2023]